MTRDYPTPKDIQKELAGHFDPDAFMLPEVILGNWWVVDTPEGNQHSCPIETYTLEEIQRIYPDTNTNIWTIINGIGVRWSAPGYMDCTEWMVWDAAEWQEAIATLVEDYEPPTIRSIVESHCALALDDETDRERLIESLEVWHVQWGTEPTDTPTTRSVLELRNKVGKK